MSMGNIFAIHRTEELCVLIDAKKRKDYIGFHWNNNGIASTVYNYGDVSNANETIIQEIKMQYLQKILDM